ncbi:unnamed protein product [Nippostrongylus brasiliensis]|uniref:Reverse transcriptase domain-containing protein n=1 Tax=Nippostrongylus brasiliensis TaxID=27835 RepID=A0A0N4YFX1_NIPBR|nr:unnamed protein product [Nippostrongylus brasiliensis]
MEKCVRQGGTISQKMFIAALQWVMESLNSNERRIRVDGKFLSNLRFADDVVIETMLRALDEAGRGLDRKKSPFMKNSCCDGATSNSMFTWGAPRCFGVF